MICDTYNNNNNYTMCRYVADMFSARGTTDGDVVDQIDKNKNKIT